MQHEVHDRCEVVSGLERVLDEARKKRPKIKLSLPLFTAATPTLSAGLPMIRHFPRWPTAYQRVHRGMSATDQSRHQHPIPAPHTPPHRPRHAACRTGMWWVVRNSSIKSLHYRNGTSPLATPTYGWSQLISRRAGWGSAAWGSLCPPGFAPHYRGCSAW